VLRTKTSEESASKRVLIRPARNFIVNVISFYYYPSKAVQYRYIFENLALFILIH
jgi:hypothetical protein